MENLDMLVEAVTKEIMRRIEHEKKKKILVLGKEKNCNIACCLQEQFDVDVKPTLKEQSDYDFVVVPTDYFLKMAKKDEIIQEDCSIAPEVLDSNKGVLDLTGKKLIHERELINKCDSSIAFLEIDKKTIVTQLALDFIKKKRLTVIRKDS